MKKCRILIYGAVAKIPHQVGKPLPQTWKTWLKTQRDRSLWVLGSTRFLDYRNYDALYSTNIGDIAIAEAVRNQLRSMMPDADFTDVDWGGLHAIAADDLSSAYQLIVIAGSGYFYFTHETGLARRVRDDISHLEKASTPVVLYGVGVNTPFLMDNTGAWPGPTDKEKEVLRRWAIRAAVRSARDYHSADILTACSGLPFQTVCDPALFLCVDTPVSFKDKIVTDCNYPKIGINFPFHGPLSTNILQKNLQLYVSMLRKIRKATGARFYYFVHYQTEFLLPQLLRDKGLPIETISGDPYDLFARYREMDCHLGGMLHSNILAVGAGTQCILLAYDVKHKAFAELLGLDSFYFDATDLNIERVMSCITRAVAEKEILGHSLEKRRIDLWSTQKSFLDSCVALTNSRRS